MTPVIFGLSGTQLTPGETALFRAVDPAGYILFARNLESAAQIRALTDSLRALAGRDNLAILIDQEGGPVARLRPPLVPDFPAASVFDRLYDLAPATAMAAARLNAQAMGVMLRELGITVNAMPMLDVRQPDAHAIITSRSYGADPQRVAALGRATLAGLHAGGVQGIIKHIPGQGRGRVDSHIALPRVDASAEDLASDLLPFQHLAGQCGFAMTAHVVYDAWDAAHPATLSARVIQTIIRETIGFDGFLMSDGIEMEALQGSLASRAAAGLAAGLDAILHCTSDLGEMQAIAEIVGSDMAPVSRARLQAAMALSTHLPGGLADLVARRDQLLALTA